MVEVVSESEPRIKFGVHRTGECSLDPGTPDLQALIQLMERMERLGAAPVLNDSLVGGNCGLLVDIAGSPVLYVSRSGKPPGLHLAPSDFVEVTSFEKDRWQACYRSSDPAHRPTSDTPLLHACLAGDSKDRHHWTQQPRVALHGHALAEGSGLDAAQRLGLPVSHHETLFSTPADLAELEELLAEHPYPQERCFIRRGHGFFILASSVADAEAAFDELVVPFLLEDQHQQQQQQEQEQEAGPTPSEGAGGSS